MVTEKPIMVKGKAKNGNRKGRLYKQEPSALYTGMAYITQLYSY